MLFSDSSTPAKEAKPPTTCKVVLTVVVGSCPVKMATLAARAAQVEGSRKRCKTVEAVSAMVVSKINRSKEPVWDSQSRV